MDLCVFYSRCCSIVCFVFRKFTENVSHKEATFLAYLANNSFLLTNCCCKDLERKAFSDKLRNKVVGKLSHGKLRFEIKSSDLTDFFP